MHACLTVAVFSQYSSAQQHSPFQDPSLSLSFYSLHQPPSVSPLSSAAQWAMTAITGLISVVYSGREVQLEGAEPTFSSPAVRSRDMGKESSPLPSTTSSELQTVGQASSWLMRMCRKVDFIHIGPRAGEKTLLRPPQSNKTSSGNAVESCLTNLKSIPVYYLYLALTLPNARIYLSWSFNF